MEKREAKTKDQSSSQCSHADYIPFDLTRQILVNLPAKSLMRFRCVSKLWASLTSDPDFIISFTTKQRSCLLLIFKKNDKQLFISLSQHKNLGMCLPHVEKYPLNLIPKQDQDYGHIFKFQSVHGLISFNYSCHMVIWNPSMRQHFTFQKPNDKSTYIRSYLGYDPIGSTYKVLWMSIAATEEIHVLTLGAQESWRPIKNIRPWCLFPGKGICINGFLYFSVIQGRLAAIMSFDVRTEKFKSIKTHSSIHIHDVDAFKTTLSLMSYNGRLAWVILESSCHKLWVLEDAEKEEWSCLHLPLCPYDHPIPNVDYCLSGVTDGGEFVYVSVAWEDKEIHICYYDPKRNNNIRTIKIESFEDEDFWLRSGSCRDHHDDWEFIGSMPNHIENLMSLKNFTCLPYV